MNFFKKLITNKKVIIAIIFVILGTTIWDVKPAHAFFPAVFAIGGLAALFFGTSGTILGAISSKAILGVALALSYLLGYITGAIFYVGGFLVDFALRLNMGLMNSPMIQTGWSIVLNFTNLGFVLAIIVIAFATIFQIQSYAMKQTLWKLIVAALLVNFSLVIAGGFIDFSNYLTNYFNDAVTNQGVGNLSSKLAGILQVQFLMSAKGLQEVSPSSTAANPMDPSGGRILPIN